ncbi:MAG: hypothetical protein WC570_04910 [Patescibacteria group bacterium]
MIEIINPKNINLFIKVVKDAGVGSLHVITDFDRTLTRAFVDGHKVNTSFGAIRQANYLPAEYVRRANEYYDYYHPWEIDPDMSRAEKAAIMREWWTRHLELLVEYGLTESKINEIAQLSKFSFRSGMDKFIKLTSRNNIPVVIMSAGMGNMIDRRLAMAGFDWGNIYVVANYLDFDQKGQMKGIKGEVIHSLNKYETTLTHYPWYENIASRKNVILLGDSVDDVGMVEGFDYHNLIKIGWLNDEVDKLMSSYRRVFDVVITEDNGLEYVNNILRGIIA